MIVSRRAFLITASAAAMLSGCGEATTNGSQGYSSIPLGDITLKPSIFSRSVETNLEVLRALVPDRLLHNFRTSAGLEPKGEVYGGWEARGIAGHSLGHYLTACSINAARPGSHLKDRVQYIVSELAACQAAHGDGYVGGTTVEREGEEVDGKIIFEELRRGEIRTSGFDINGGWVPLYTWHKVQAGLIDAYRLAGEEAALPVLVGMSTYLADVLDTLDDEQMQTLLAAEHGGLNESYADLFAITGNQRWLDLAERIRHKAVLDPLSNGVDNLPGLHANTQIPKVIGLARLHELTGKDQYAQTSNFFYRTVTDHHSYAIGGNSEREHFGSPDVISTRITDRTCEACNSYNMLKLTRHLWQWAPDAQLFDEYEQTYLNHIVAHQHPDTGMYVYFMPMRSGARRTYSTLEESFWCCVGSGMESHSKHGDSAFWQRGGEAFFVNLFMPASINWREGGMKLSVETDFPRSEEVSIAVDGAPSSAREIALRIPQWTEGYTLLVNGEPAEHDVKAGYAYLQRSWQAGDRIDLHLPMPVKSVGTPDDASVVTFHKGPLVLAADLGVDEERKGILPPALVERPSGGYDLQPSADDPYSIQLNSTLPEPVTLKPFYDQYDNRTAVYFPTFTREEWAVRENEFRQEQLKLAALEERTFDVIYLGEMQPERDHNFKTNQSDVIVNGGRSGRTAWWGVGNFIEFDLAVGQGPVVLRALYWGNETNKDFDISIDGEVIATERRQTQPEEVFVEVEYTIPMELTEGKDTVRVRFETNGSDAPVYEVRTLQNVV